MPGTPSASIITQLGRRLAVLGAAMGVALAAHSSAGVDRGAALSSAKRSVTVAELNEHAGVLADDTLEGREAGTRGGRAAARYLVQNLQNSGLQPAGENGNYTQRFYGNMQNLLAKIPGSDPPVADECILIGAHYDHVGYGSRRNSYGPIGYIHNGADDNASGVATVLEVASGLAEADYRPRRTLLFALWDGEEKDLLGSRHWLRQPTVPLEEVRLAINLDMVGRLRESELQVGGTRTGAGLRRLRSSRDIPDGVALNFTWEFEGNSDHWAFFERQLPTLFLHTGLHDNYHRPSDDIELLNVAGMQQVASYLVGLAARAADAEQLPAFRAASRNERPATQRAREAPLAALPPRLGAKWRHFAAADPPYVEIQSVIPGSAAALAGLVEGDRVVRIDGRPLTRRDLFPAIIWRANDEVTLTIWPGDGAPQRDVRVTPSGKPVRLGLAWRRDAAEPSSVLVTRVAPLSPADRAGIAVHDRLLGLDGEPIGTEGLFLSQIRQKLAAGAEQLLFEVESSGRIRTVEVDLRLPTAPPKDAEL